MGPGVRTSTSCEGASRSLARSSGAVQESAGKCRWPTGAAGRGPAGPRQNGLLPGGSSQRTKAAQLACSRNNRASEACCGRCGGQAPGVLGSVQGKASAFTSGHLPEQQAQCKAKLRKWNSSACLRSSRRSHSFVQTFVIKEKLWVGWKKFSNKATTSQCVCEKLASFQ